jgi:hypothetical protein
MRAIFSVIRQTKKAAEEKIHRAIWMSLEQDREVHPYEATS